MNTNRHIRIFLSSTFSDMQQERQALVQTVERLQPIALSRYTHISLVDLRWGVTEEESRSGKVISACLNEIEHSRPFFVGLLGDRYGFVPEMSELVKNRSIEERYPWIVDDVENGLSITEIEMQYGALRNAGQVEAAFFIKSNASCTDNNDKMEKLKNQILQQNRFPVSKYDNIDDLCIKFERILFDIMNRMFPEENLSKTQQIRLSQRSFIDYKYEIFIEENDVTNQIDNFMSSNDSSLVVTGPVGAGKSALMASWIKKNDGIQDFNLLYYFIDNPLFGASSDYLLKILCDEIESIYCLPTFFSNDDKDRLDSLLDKVSRASKPLVIIIDGVDKMIGYDDQLLLWLPIPRGNIKCIYSVSEGTQASNVFKRLRIAQIDITRPSNNLKRRIAESYLGRVGKKMSENQLSAIASTPLTSNLKTLRALLDELICFGSHERLDSYLQTYLSQKTESEFYNAVVNRLENDYGIEQTRSFLSALTLSLHGLMEDELVGASGLRQIDFYALYGAIFDCFVNTNGVVKCANKELLNVARTRYNLDNFNDYNVRSTRGNLISYLEKKVDNNCSIDMRVSQELAYQYYEMFDYSKLYPLVMNLDIAAQICNKESLMFKMYWDDLMIEDEYNITDYLSLTNCNNPDAFDDIANFFELYYVSFKEKIDNMLKEQDVVLSFRKKNLQITESVYGRCSDKYTRACMKMGDYLMSLGQGEEAFGFYQSAMNYYCTYIPERLDEIYLKYIRYYNVTDINIASDYLDKYLALVDLMEKEGKVFVEPCMTAAHILHRKHNEQSAMTYFNKAIQLSEKYSGETSLLTSITYQGVAMWLFELGQKNEAVKFGTAALDIWKKLGLPEDRMDIMLLQAMINMC